jgi:RHS repeat-associated protein
MNQIMPWTVYSSSSIARGLRLDNSYEPYGEVLSNTGDVASSYSFAGEWLDTTGLIFLRARNYNPQLGRFISRDAWGGDYLEPLSLNLWNYGYSNPVKYTDPSGRVPTENEINRGRHVYSCNCGWIDFAHANPESSSDIFRLLDARPSILGNVPVREDVLLVTMRMFFTSSGISADINTVIRKGITGQTRNAVALGMFLEREEHREWLQALSPWARTSFSEEDLTSDLIGFYMRTMGMFSARDVNLSWNWLSRVCGFPEDKEDARKWSLEVFDEYPQFQQIKAWGAPKLVCTSAINEECWSIRKWPPVFTTINPEKPRVDGDWWLYRGIDQDGLFLTTNLPDVYYLYGR